MEGEAEEAFQARRAEWAARLATRVEELKIQTAREHDEVVAVGGLHIVGTERHEARRIDNQLRGRAGRQGDPGSSIFFLSLEDDLMRIFASERIAKLMETLGMKEGEQIEHRMLTRSIEGAQKKVEAHNYDIRKNMLEYDDVMNQQRKSVYRLRRMVLGFGAGVPVVEFDDVPKSKKKLRTEKVYGWNDAGEHFLDLFDDLVREMVADCCPESRKEWDLDALALRVREQFGVDMTFAEPSISKAADARAALEEQIYKVVEKAHRQKEELFGHDAEGVPLLRRYEQYFYLQAIDALWKDHLLQMDHLRQGIGLRGYGQRDPKQEYKKEGYEMFTRMTWNVRSSVVGNVLRLVPARQETAQEIEQKRVALGKKQRVIESHPGADGEAEAPRREQVTRGQPKVGRNDPCPCGSGKKYKKCHGASEAAA
jgi:preprotein translocase subunit SecA